MSAPRARDWAQNLGRSSRSASARCVQRFRLGGCAETRRSTDSHVVVLGGAVITTTTQAQPGLPATSSPDAELRGIVRACCEAQSVYELATRDFGLDVQVPRLWSDSSTSITAAKRIGPGSKLRHLAV